MNIVIALTWAGLVLGAASFLTPGPARSRARLLAAVGSTTGGATVGGFIPWIGALLLSFGGRSVTDDAARRVGRAVLAGMATLLVVAPAAPVVALAVWSLPRWTDRRARHRVRADLVRHLPEVADLFVLVVGAGCTVPLAVDAVARRAPTPLGGELRRVIEQVGLGRGLSDALDDLPGRVGEEIRPLVAALVASDRYGAPLLDGLVRLGAELRTDRRRRAEEAARRVPVQLLFPLVFCTLPAFALLTVAPLLAGALRSLRL